MARSRSDILEDGFLLSKACTFSPNLFAINREKDTDSVTNETNKVCYFIENPHTRSLWSLTKKEIDQVRVTLMNGKIHMIPAIFVTSYTSKIIMFHLQEEQVINVRENHPFTIGFFTNAIIEGIEYFPNVANLYASDLMNWSSVKLGNSQIIAKSNVEFIDDQYHFIIQIEKGINCVLENPSIWTYEMQEGKLQQLTYDSKDGLKKISTMKDQIKIIFPDKLDYRCPICLTDTMPKNVYIPCGHAICGSERCSQFFIESLLCPYKCSKRKRNVPTLKVVHNLCFICLDRSPSHMLQPCGDFGVCDSCKNNIDKFSAERKENIGKNRKRLNDCPICKQKIIGTERIYLN